MKIRLLKKVRQAILNEPKQFGMNSWFGSGVCGTTACIGGWAIILSGKFESPFAAVKASGYRTLHSPETAECLGLSTQQASRLFYVSSWPERYQYGNQSSSAKSRARNAAARINLFIRTKGKS